MAWTSEGREGQKRPRGVKDGEEAVDGSLYSPTVFIEGEVGESKTSDRVGGKELRLGRGKRPSGYNSTGVHIRIDRRLSKTLVSFATS